MGDLDAQSSAEECLMIKQYINGQGETVVIKEMPDSYLENAYAYYRQRMRTLREKGGGSAKPWIVRYYRDLQKRVEAIRSELLKRDSLDKSLED